jgi:cytochrome subunit of sulfide dehydrogenase
MIAKEMTGLALLAGAALFSLSLSTSSWAADAGKLAEGCANCHGKDGVSSESDVPTIAGFSAPYLDESLGRYKNKQRNCPETKYHSGPKKGQKTDMCSIAKELSAADIKQLSEHYAGKKFVRAKQKFDPALAQKGAKLHERSCEKCHADNGSSPKDDSGILAGQWMPYLQEALADFKNGKRPIDKKMKPKIEKLDKADFDALVHYYGSLQ